MLTQRITALAAACSLAIVTMSNPSEAGRPINKLVCPTGQVPVADTTGWVCGNLPICPAGQVAVGSVNGSWTCQAQPICPSGQVAVGSGNGGWTCDDLPICAEGEVAVGDSAGGWTCAALPVLEDQQKYVFVTSELVQGSNIGGLMSGDWLCQNFANRAGLPGTYKAWLATSSFSPATSFAKSTVPYLKTNGVKIADNWDDLVGCDAKTGGCLQGPINIDENGDPLSDNDKQVWTGVQSNGTAHLVTSADTNCANWTGVGTLLYGDVGIADVVTAGWTLDSSTALRCDLKARLYCFQQ